MEIRKSIQGLSKGEICLWSSSVMIIAVSFLLSASDYYLTLIASLIGVTALIFVAKGYVLGQILTVIFAVFYGIISYFFGYYGEMITYLLMTSPIAIMAVISWKKNPYEQTVEVKVQKMTKSQIIIMLILTTLVTGIFYFILKALGTTNLFFSTVSIATSFIASYLTFMRSSYYAVGYMANDIILIILWVLATKKDITYLPMIICFVMFFINDAYGFINWKMIEIRQAAYQNV